MIDDPNSSHKNAPTLTPCDESVHFTRCTTGKQGVTFKIRRTRSSTEPSIMPEHGTGKRIQYARRVFVVDRRARVTCLNMKPILGIIGGIGSGKSTVAHILREFGGHLIVGDQLGHEALLQPEIKTKVVERWGSQVLDTQGNPDRKAIGRIVFADINELRALESLLFPYIGKKIVEEIDHAQTRADVQFIVLDAAVMVEAGWHKRCDKVLFVDAPRDLRVARLKETRGWSEQELERRENMQLNLDEKKLHAHAAIVNDGDMEKLARQLKDALVRWRIIC